MKHWIGRATLILALALALILGVVALAENVEAEGAAPEASAEESPEVSAEESAEATDSAALEDAFEAYNSARESSHADALEAELKEYVAAGKMTQEQADLILGYYKERQSLRDGVCPNCGYEFQTSDGFAWGGRGGKGGRGMRGMGGMHGMRGVTQRYGAGDATAAGAPLQGNVL